jgi:hypothetical protein
VRISIMARGSSSRPDTLMQTGSAANLDKPPCRRGGPYVFERPPILLSLALSTMFNSRLSLRGDARSSARTPPERASKPERSVSPPPTVEDPRSDRVGVVLAVQRRLERLGNQLLTRASNIVDAGAHPAEITLSVQPLPASETSALSGMRSRQHLRRTLASVDQSFEPLAPLGARFHNIPFRGCGEQGVAAPHEGG